MILLKLKELQIQTHKVKAELLINNNKVTIGHQFLENIASDLPDIKGNQSIFGILANLDNLYVRKRISEKDNLSKRVD